MEGKFGKITKPKLIKLINEALKRVELDRWLATKIYKSRYSDHQYQGGAYFWRVILEDKKKEYDNNEIMCFYKFKDCELYLNQNMKLVIVFKGRSNIGTFENMEIEFK